VAEWLPVTGALGIAGGYTLDALASALPRRNLADLTVVPVVGGWDSRNRYLDVNELARRIADRLGAQVHYLHAPGMLDDEETKEALLRDSGVAATTRHWASLDAALVGVSGGPTILPGYGTVMDRLDDSGRRRLLDRGVVGDVSGHLIRADGTIIEDEWSRRTIAISIEELRRIPRVMAVAAGSNKHQSLLGACGRPHQPPRHRPCDGRGHHPSRLGRRRRSSAPGRLTGSPIGSGAGRYVPAADGVVMTAAAAARTSAAERAPSAVAASSRSEPLVTRLSIRRISSSAPASIDSSSIPRPTRTAAPRDRRRARRRRRPGCRESPRLDGRGRPAGPRVERVGDGREPGVGAVHGEDVLGEVVAADAEEVDLGRELGRAEGRARDLDQIPTMSRPALGPVRIQRGQGVGHDLPKHGHVLERATMGPSAGVVPVAAPAGRSRGPASG
jgi:hypothetical protein